MKVNISIAGTATSESANSEVMMKKMEAALISKVKLTKAEVRTFMHGGDPTTDTSAADKKIQDFMFNPEENGYDQLWVALGFRVKDVHTTLEDLGM